VNVFVNGEEKEQEARLAIFHKGDFERKTRDIKYYSQGVFVLSDESLDGALKIDFPSAVEVVEGRDELKYNENFSRVMDVVWDKVLDYCRDHKSPKDLKALQNLTYFFNYSAGNRMRNKLSFKDLFFPNISYAMASYGEEYRSTLAFFGDSIGTEIYSEPNWTRQQLWSPEFLGFKDLVERETELTKRVTKEELVNPTDESTPKLYNVDVLRNDYEYSLVQLKRFQGGNSPFLYANNGTVCVNTNHPYFRTEGGFTSKYGLTASLEMALGSGERQIEEKLIQGGRER